MGTHQIKVASSTLILDQHFFPVILRGSSYFEDFLGWHLFRKDLKWRKVKSLAPVFIQDYHQNLELCFLIASISTQKA